MSFDELLSDIDSLPGDTVKKEQVIEILSSYEGLSLYINTRSRLWRKRDALRAKLEQAGYSPSDIARVFQSRLGVPERTARRWASEGKR
jgi:hypothetical protein